MTEVTVRECSLTWSDGLKGRLERARLQAAAPVIRQQGNEY